jgi:hypothetical protein
MENIKRIILLLCLCVLSLLFIACTSRRKIVQPIPNDNLRLLSQSIHSTAASMIYLCEKYNVSYPAKGFERTKEREVCSCYAMAFEVLEWKVSINTLTHSIGCNTLIIWDSNFVSNYILPLIREKKDRKIIEYTLANSNDSTFNNIIDYNNKVIINDRMYYYPLNIGRGISVEVLDIEWFMSIFPRSSWIYKPDCFDIGKGMWISLLIPLMDEE